jgi:hypothetical protein
MITIPKLTSATAALSRFGAGHIESIINELFLWRQPQIEVRRSAPGVRRTISLSFSTNFL